MTEPSPEEPGYVAPPGAMADREQSEDESDRDVLRRILSRFDPSDVERTITAIRGNGFARPDHEAETDQGNWEYARTASCGHSTSSAVAAANRLPRVAAPDHQAEAPSVVRGETALETFDRLDMTVNITVAAIIAHYRQLLAARPVVDDVEELAQALGQKRFEEYREKFGGVSDPTYWINLERKELALAFRRIENARAALGGDQ